MDFFDIEIFIPEIEWGEDMLQQLEALCETDMSPGMRALMRRLRK